MWVQATRWSNEWISSKWILTENSESVRQLVLCVCGHVCYSGCDSVLATYNKILFFCFWFFMTRLNLSVCHGVAQGGEGCFAKYLWVGSFCATWGDLGIGLKSEEEYHQYPERRASWRYFKMLICMGVWGSVILFTGVWCEIRRWWSGYRHPA